MHQKGLLGVRSSTKQQKGEKRLCVMDSVFKYIYNWLCLTECDFSDLHQKERCCSSCNVWMCSHRYFNILCASFACFCLSSCPECQSVLACEGLRHNECSEQSLEPFCLPLLMMLIPFPFTCLQRLHVRGSGVRSRVLLWPQNPGTQCFRERMQYGVQRREEQPMWRS